MRLHVALAIAAALITASCSSYGGIGPGRGPTPALNAAHVALLPTTAPGLPTFDQEKFQQLLGELRGTPVVVNIWASWCGPCRIEAPILAQAARTYGRSVQFLGVDILDTRGAATAFEREFNIPYPSVFDPSGDIRDAFGFIGQPDTIFFRADGSRAATWSGPLDQQVLSTNIDRLLGRSGVPSPSES